MKIKIKGALTDSFQCNTGVKQGCNLNPTLSNIFQNDLHDIFNESECHQVTLGGLSFNSMSWADDLVLVSESAEGLQMCLNNLEKYCDKWGLTVNTNKTKCMIMCNGRLSLTNVQFTYGGQNLEIVDRYKYLGIMVTYNCNINKMIDDRILKANRAIFLVRQALSAGSNVSIDLAESIFDKKVSPILLYGCPLWGVPKPRMW